MSFHQVEPLPIRTQVLRAVGEACLPLALEFAWRPSKMSVVDFVGQGVICVVLFFFWHANEGYDIEVTEQELRKIEKGQIQRVLRSERIRYVKEVGRGPFRELMISDTVFAGIPFRSISIPVRAQDYEMIKAQVLGWLEHPRGMGLSLTQ